MDISFINLDKTTRIPNMQCLKILFLNIIPRERIEEYTLTCCATKLQVV